MKKQEDSVEKRPFWKSYLFPSQVYLIFGNELCERFCYYGLRTILTIYLSTNFGVGDGIAVIIFHIFNTLAYFSPIFGAVLSDSFIGKYKTILYLSIVYASGNILLALTSIPNIVEVINIAGPVISLLLIAIGTGGIKPSVCAFGAEQFSEKDTNRLQKYFAVFYFCINIGGLISMLITPIIRSNITCFGQECYLAAFGIPALIFVVAFVFFLAGTKIYKTSKPDNNVLLDVAKTTCTALKNKFRLRKTETKHEHWLDYARTGDNSFLIDDIKSLYKVLFLFIPLPIFWTLYDQQGSKWVLQALRMDGNINAGAIIHPDQLQAVNAGLVLLLIPIFDSIIYPLFAKCGMLKNLLHRMIAGMILVSFSFFTAAVLEYQINTEALAKKVPEGNISLRMLNLFDTPLNVFSVNASYPQLLVNPVQHSSYYHFSLSPFAVLNLSYTLTNGSQKVNKSSLFKLAELQAVDGRSYTLKVTVDQQLKTSLVKDIDVGIAEHAMLRIMIATVGTSQQVTFYKINVGGINYDYMMNNEMLDIKTNIGNQVVSINQQKLKVDGSLVAGAVYSFAVVMSSDGKIIAQNFTMDVEPPAIHLLWQIVQYVVLTAGEILFSITGLDFAYREAPSSMKSCVIAAWYITTSLGNLIVVIFAEVKVSDDMAIEFTIYGFLLIVTAIIFSFMAHQFTKQKLERQRKESDVVALE